MSDGFEVIEMKNDSDDLRKYLDGRDAFTGEEMREILCELKQSYEIARIVDPEECRVILIGEDGTIEYGESCYSVWGTEARCSHCTSFRACKVNAELTRSERIGGRDYRVRSVPVRLIVGDGTRYSCTMELINPERNRMRRVEENDNDLNFLFFHDVLTGTLSRYGLQRAIRRELMENPDKAYMLVMTGVSHLRLQNDRFGKQEEEDLRMAIGGLLKNYGKGNGIVGRVETDRFALFVPAEDFSVESLQELLLFAEHRIASPEDFLVVHAAIYPVWKQNHPLPVAVMLDHAHLALDTVLDRPDRQLVWFTDEMLRKEIARQNEENGSQQDPENGKTRMDPEGERSGE
jgi:GGDEF domain-containing protein